MRNLLLVVAITFSTFCVAQINYQRIYSTSVQSTTADIAWSLLDQSYVTSMLDSTGVTLLKFDQTGLPMWNRHFEFTGEYLTQTAQIVVAGDGNIYCCTQVGSMTSGGDVSYLVMAADQWMTPLWSKIYSAQSPGVYDNLELAMLPDGNLMIVESVQGHVGYIKIDLSGNVIASNIYRDNLTAETKGPGFDGAAFADGSMIFTGKRESDIMVVRTDPSGNTSWSRVLNDGTNYYHTKSVAALSDGSAIMSGYSMNGAFLMRMDANGATMWYKEYASAASSYGVFYDVEQIDANSFMTVGNFSTETVLAKFDLNGQVLSSITLDDNVMDPMGLTNYTVNPSGNIAWPFYAYDPLASWSMLSGLNVMTSFNSNGCGIIPVALQQSSGTIVPADLSITIYQIPQTITDTVVTPIVSQRVVQMDDYCWLIGIDDGAAPNNSGLTVQNNLLVEGNVLNFSIPYYRGDAIYTIHDLNGREVANGKVNCSNGNQIAVPGSATFASGMYVLSVVAGENRMAEKFIVR